MRFDASLYNAIKSGATMQNVKRSEYIRSILVDKTNEDLTKQNGKKQSPVNSDTF